MNACLNPAQIDGSRAYFLDLARLELAAARELGAPMWALRPDDRGYAVRCLERAASYRARAHGSAAPTQDA